MALGAHRLGPRPDHLVRWVLDSMIAVARYAAGQPRGGERRFMRASLKQLCLEDMAV